MSGGGFNVDNAVGDDGSMDLLDAVVADMGKIKEELEQTNGNVSQHRERLQTLEDTIQVLYRL